MPDLLQILEHETHETGESRERKCNDYDVL